MQIQNTVRLNKISRQSYAKCNDVRKIGRRDVKQRPPNWSKKLKWLKGVSGGPATPRRTSCRSRQCRASVRIYIYSLPWSEMSARTRGRGEKDSCWGWEPGGVREKARWISVISCRHRLHGALYTSHFTRLANYSLVMRSELNTPVNKSHLLSGISVDYIKHDWQGDRERAGWNNQENAYKIGDQYLQRIQDVDNFKSHGQFAV